MTLKARNRLTTWLSIFAAVAAVYCLGHGLCTLNSAGQPWRKIRGQIMVGAWLVLTPFYFWCDWVFLRGPLNKDQKEELQHTHDLARNIWIGYVLVLGALYQVFDLKPGG